LPDLIEVAKLSEQFGSRHHNFRRRTDFNVNEQLVGVLNRDRLGSANLESSLRLAAELLWRRLPFLTLLRVSTESAISVRVNNHNPTVGDEVSRVHSLEHRTPFHLVAGLQEFPSIDPRFAVAAAPGDWSRSGVSMRGSGSLQRT